MNSSYQLYMHHNHVGLETSHTLGGEFSGPEKCGFKNLWEIKPEFFLNN